MEEGRKRRSAFIYCQRHIHIPVSLCDPHVTDDNCKVECGQSASVYSGKQ